MIFWVFFIVGNNYAVECICKLGGWVKGVGDRGELGHTQPFWLSCTRGLFVLLLNVCLFFHLPFFDEKCQSFVKQQQIVLYKTDKSWPNCTNICQKWTKADQNWPRLEDSSWVRATKGAWARQRTFEVGRGSQQQKWLLVWYNWLLCKYWRFVFVFLFLFFLSGLRMNYIECAFCLKWITRHFPHFTITTRTKIFFLYNS